MKNLAYDNLLRSINNNELDEFFRTNSKYVVADRGDRGQYFFIDYYAMADAINRYIEENPSKKSLIKDVIIKCLKESTIGGVRCLIEMAAYQLRYNTPEPGFLDEDILAELRNQITIHSDEFLHNPDYNYEELDELAYSSSGRHFL